MSAIDEIKAGVTEGKIYPKSFMPVDDGYIAGLRHRAHMLAPILWKLTIPEPAISWERALQDPKLAEPMATCLAAAEMCIRMIDVITAKNR